MLQEELSALVQSYECRGHFEEVVGLLEAGLGLERAHVGIFTELSILLSNYRPVKRKWLEWQSDKLLTVLFSSGTSKTLRCMHQHSQGEFHIFSVCESSYQIVCLYRSLKRPKKRISGLNLYSSTSNMMNL
jgi:hypothetical protein